MGRSLHRSECMAIVVIAFVVVVTCIVRFDLLVTSYTRDPLEPEEDGASARSRYSEQSYESRKGTEGLRNSFERRFNETCLKYPFVERHWHLLEHPPEKQVSFVFQEDGLSNGGIGDRMAGAVTAAFMALRFNRSLVLKSSNGIDKLFRPYRKPGNVPQGFYESNIDGKFTYSNTSWTNFQPWKQNQMQYEYDLFFCENAHQSNHFRCSSEHKEWPNDIILLRGNLCYLCRWMELNDTYPDLHRQMRELLGPEGHSLETNLYEAAGCVLRLALWPTEELWEEVEKILSTNFGGFLLDPHQSVQSEPPKAQLRSRRASREGLEQRSQKQSLIGSGETVGTFEKNMALPEFPAGVSLEHVKEQQLSDAYEHSDNAADAQRRILNEKIISYPHGESPREDTGDGEHMVSAHFRCGDYAFVSDALSRPMDENLAQFARAPNQSVCVHATDSKHPHEESGFMKFGSPDMLGSCASQVGNNIRTRTNEKDLVAFISSDSDASTEQIVETIDWPNRRVIVGEHTCHVDYNSTYACLKNTIAQWFILSLSDVIVTQTIFKIPRSGYSRYAGIYGLRDNPFRDARNCSYAGSTREMSHRAFGNWVCLKDAQTIGGMSDWDGDY